eukprot:m.1182668 g.1182668  ORF g.1182668 m.1182668 type:complete len:648 (-) comp24538_c0_seq2:653-2596(-)
MAEKQNAQEGGKDWFGVQVEVTHRLLEAENRKLEELVQEFDKANNFKELGFQTLAQKRLQAQFRELNKEYTQAAQTMLASTTRQRSNPTLGLKTAGKRRGSIFANMVNKKGSDEEDGAEEEGTESKQAPAATTSLVVQNSRVKSGTLEALVDYFLPTATGNGDKLYNFTFLMSFRLFLKPLVLIETMVRRVEALLKEEASDIATVAQRYAKLIIEWTSVCAYDFRDPRVMKCFNQLCALVGAASADTNDTLAVAKQTIEKHVTRLGDLEQKFKQEDHEQQRMRDNIIASSAEEGVMPTSMESGLQDVTPASVAEQLWLIEQERFSVIEAHEFVDTVDMSDDASGTHGHGTMRTANIASYIAWFNRLSSVVATQVCMTDNRKKRCKVIEFWIDVGKECRVRHNYNSVMAIVSALNMTSVTRLKKTWTALKSKSTQDMKELESVLDPSSNFKNYRQTIAALPEDAPCIPFFSLLVKDIYFIKEGSKQSPNGHINFERFWPISECLAEFRIRQQQCEKMPATIAVDPNVQYFLRMTAAVATEAELYRSSVEKEPPSKADGGRTMQRLRRMSSSEGILIDDRGRASSISGAAKNAAKKAREAHQAKHAEGTDSNTEAPASALTPRTGSVVTDADDEGDFGFGGLDADGIDC